MMDQALWWTSHCDGFLESLKSQLAMQAVTDGPSDNTTCKETNDASEMQPPFFRPNIRNVSIPFLIGTCCREILRENIGRDRKCMMTV
ncbi:hypothetical protein M798_16430 [Brucella melitensis ADMAS-G1]|nr:hypothetical protein M798_16430 [Brucella melitensis ADMAS-G1]